ncbi:MAG TPA: hypothetical protein PKL73_12425 [Polyangiaceae bacterium]|nr:MAG: hypothetical protein BWY17_01569 [Deltaproteobacteria bacterium ADurb.Bin207]HNS97747.1 hypothetical protein [Polyangiaceae bacterium]HNZ22767.1 hypothetical protein [Polyangiaceae bacterium]HOD22832.1 hypothetical protein [Polyangiaceae bacterium]HOE47665.1 hypothetical protein [Polyangiaceae bacterium]
MNHQGWGAPPDDKGATPFAYPEQPVGGFPGAAPGVPFGSEPGMPQPWNVTDSFAFAWNRIKADPGTIIGTMLLGYFISNLPSTIARFIPSDEPSDETSLIVTIVLALLGGLFSTFMMGGMTLFTLNVARGSFYRLNDIFQGGPFFLSILGANLLIGLGVMFGTMLLIVPGIIIALGLCLTTLIIVDRRCGAIEALQQSWRLMNGHKLNVFLWWLMAAVVSLVGILACCIGTIVTAPLLQIAFAFVYLKISGQTTADSVGA